MDKDIRKLISEAFGEIYENIFSEDAAKLAEKLSPKEKAVAERHIEDVKTLGANSSFNHSYGQNESTTKIFNYVAERLIEDYKNSKDAKIADWIKSAFYPSEGSKFYNQLVKKWSSKGREEVQDAVLNAYEQIMLGVDDQGNSALDKALASYTTADGKFGAWVVNNLNKRMINYFKGYAGGSSEDMFAGGQTTSMDVEDDTGKTLGDKMAGSMGGMQSDFVDPEDMDKLKEIQATVLGWLKNNVSERQYVAWRELTAGSTPEQVAEDYPELFQATSSSPASWAVARNFSQLVNSDKADDLSELISHAFKIDWNMKDVNPKALRQTYAMAPEFGSGEYTQRTKISTPDMEAAQKNLNNVMGNLGLKPAQFNSQVKIEKILSDLRNSGKEEVANAVEDAVANLEAATERAKSRGQYDVQTPYIPSSEEEEVGVEKLFEGINIKGVDLDALIERVMRRIS